MIKRYIKRLSDSGIDLLFPRRCPVCEKINKEGQNFCPSCLQKLSFVTPPLCMRCGKEVDDERDEYCSDCRRHKRSFLRGVSLLNYNSYAAHSMAAIKYHNKREYLEYYAEETMKRLGARLRAFSVDLIVPVPVHPKRRRKRGFNQAEILAKKLGERLGLPVDTTILLRSKKTEPMKMLTPAERLKNLEHAFTASGANGKTILLVDDIYTTGSTVEACTRALLNAGAKKVYFFTLCIGHGE